MFSIILFICYIISIKGIKITTKPSCRAYKENGNFFWKIGKKKNFQKSELHQIILNDFPYCVYNEEGVINAISDICIHRGASLSYGKLLNHGNIQCPYHGWEYNKGTIKAMPGCKAMKGSCGVPNFLIKEKNDDVYLCPTYDTHSKTGILPLNNDIYTPPEANDKDFVRIHGKINIKNNHKIITENVLDMMHISYVHSFGNQMSPIPFEIKYKNISDYGGKTTFYYNAGPTSMSSVIGNVKHVKVENEFYLPDTTVTRVYAGEIIKTIVTHCFPINENESILFYDLYRNFLTHSMFNCLFEKQMDITLNEDISILNNIHTKYNKGFMNTKYDITQMKYREKWNKHYMIE